MVDELPLHDAQRLILAAIGVVRGTEKVPISSALGRVLAEEVLAQAAFPMIPLSQVDGFALCAEDGRGASPDHPRTLTVEALIRAGDPQPPPLHPGTAVAVTTGAPLPPGADAVVPFEEVDEARHGRLAAIRAIRLVAPVTAGQHVTLPGQQARPGDHLLGRGEVLGIPELGLLAFHGCETVKVLRKPRIGILATGSELIPWQETPTLSQVRCSNLLVLSLHIRRSGCIPVELGLAPDKADVIREIISRAVSDHHLDFLITTGGASRGPFDLTVPVLREMGDVRFSRLAVSPGQGSAFVSVRGKPVLCLPGGPGAMRILFEELARPALLRLAGHRYVLRARVKARIAGKVRWQKVAQIVPACFQPADEGWLATVRKASDFRCPGSFAGVLFLGAKEMASEAWAQGVIWDWPETVEWVSGPAPNPKTE